MTSTTYNGRMTLNKQSTIIVYDIKAAISNVELYLPAVAICNEILAIFSTAIL